MVSTHGDRFKVRILTFASLNTDVNVFFVKMKNIEYVV